MKKQNVAVEILKILVSIFVGWFLWVCIFSALTPQEANEMIEPFHGASVVLGVLTGLIVSIITKYNVLHKAYQHTKSSLSNIEIFKERVDRLLDKANRVADKYMNFEKGAHVEVAHERGTNSSNKTGKIHNAFQFQTVLESYPNLKSNESVMELLNQIKDCENSLAAQKINYNDSVEYYNTLIHSFPMSILSSLFHFKEVQFYKGPDEDNLISYDELGI